LVVGKAREKTHTYTHRHPNTRKELCKVTNKLQLRRRKDPGSKRERERERGRRRCAKDEEGGGGGCRQAGGSWSSRERHLSRPRRGGAEQQTSTETLAQIWACAHF